MIKVNIEQDDFLKIKETLTRIGMKSKSGKKLFQSCHILHKKGKYYIVHYKELFQLDNCLKGSITEFDYKVLNRVAALLKEWELVDFENDPLPCDMVPMNKLYVLPYKEKNNWKLIAKYTAGNVPDEWKSKSN